MSEVGDNTLVEVIAIEEKRTETTRVLERFVVKVNGHEVGTYMETPVVKIGNGRDEWTSVTLVLFPNQIVARNSYPGEFDAG